MSPAGRVHISKSAANFDLRARALGYTRTRCCTGTLQRDTHVHVHRERAVFTPESEQKRDISKSEHNKSERSESKQRRVRAQRPGEVSPEPGRAMSNTTLVRPEA